MVDFAAVSGEKAGGVHRGFFDENGWNYWVEAFGAEFVDDELDEREFEQGGFVFEVVEAGAGAVYAGFDVDDVEVFAEFDVVFWFEIEFWFCAVGVNDLVFAVVFAVRDGFVWGIWDLEGEFVDLVFEGFDFWFGGFDLFF